MTSWVDAVLAVEPVARRAPSVLNTQPVVLRRGDDWLAVCWDPARYLPVLDPSGDQLWLSLGAFIEALAQAAAWAGRGVAAEDAFDPGRHRFALLRAGPVASGPRYGLDELTNRVTGIGRFADPSPSLDEIAYLAEHAGVQNEVRVVAWERGTGDPLVERAHRWLFTDAAARRELRAWIRPGADDGIEPAALGIAGWRAMLFRHSDGLLDDSFADLLGGLPHGLGTVAALVDVARRPDPAGGGAMGRALLRLSLQGIRHGLRLQWLPHVTACPATRQALAALLESAGVDGRVGCVFRIGTPETEPPLSRRRKTPVLGPDQPM